MKRLNFINKRLIEKNETRAYINDVDEAMLEYYRVLAKQIKSLSPEPQLSDFIIHHRIKKMVNYYLFRWVQALQYMFYTSDLNK